MRYVVAVLMLAACAGDLTAPVPVALPVPVLRFVGVCERPALWWVRQGTHAPIMYFMEQTDSVVYEPTGTQTEVRWMELDGNAQPVQNEATLTDSVGAGRIVAYCAKP